jgi:hypothetical protein
VSEYEKTEKIKYIYLSHPLSFSYGIANLRKLPKDVGSKDHPTSPSPLRLIQRTCMKSVSIIFNAEGKSEGAEMRDNKI